MLTENEILAYTTEIPADIQRLRGEPPVAGAARGSARCLDCNHGKEHYSHLTGCVACCYPRERAPQIVDRSVLRMGRWCVPNNTAAICPHYAPNDQALRSVPTADVERKNDSGI